ncbi:VWA domain-containing protein [Streptomyces bullii]|uniref:VWA domain-containing protein n=1 Tax=Streptomyces bullii TaxID=349910 RepID=A0ABW0ULY4_9ACTN
MAEPVAEPAVEEPAAAEPTVAEESVTEREAEPEPVAENEPPVAEEQPTVAERKTDEAPVAEEKAATAEEQPAAADEPKTEAEPVEPVADEDPATAEEPKAEAEPVTQAVPEAEPEPEAEPVTQAVPEAEPEAEAEAPQPQEPVAEDTSEGTEKPEPQAEETPEPQPEPEAEPAETATPDPKPEPIAAAAAPEPEAAPEPAAADGEPAPQGPPAADDESRTGGAGGDTSTADGEAEAEKPGAPATPATHLRSHAPGLTTAYKAAGTALEKHDLTGARAKVHLVLDRSASMRPYYKDGSAQALAEQSLALAAHLDPEATVHVVFFSTELDGTTDLTLTDHENKIDTVHAELGRMGRTSYHVAVEEVIAHHTRTTDPGTPALVIFQTDGAPDAKTPATQALTEAAKNHPSVFFSFVAFGDPENKAFDYLRKLKTPNTAHFLAGETPRELTDKEFYEAVLAGWRP